MSSGFNRHLLEEHKSQAELGFHEHLGASVLLKKQHTKKTTQFIIWASDLKQVPALKNPPHSI